MKNVIWSLIVLGVTIIIINTNVVMAEDEQEPPCVPCDLSLKSM